MNLKQFKNRRKFKGYLVIDDPIQTCIPFKNKRTTPKGIYRQRKKDILNAIFERTISLRREMYPNVKPIILKSSGIIENGSFKTHAK